MDAICVLIFFLVVVYLGRVLVSFLGKLSHPFAGVGLRAGGLFARTPADWKGKPEVGSRGVSQFESHNGN